MKIFIVFLSLIFSNLIFAQTPPVYDYKPAIQNIPQEIAEKLGYPDYKANVAETEPMFQGGIHVFRAAISNNFDNSAINKDSERLVTTLFFIVEKDGTISEVTANGANADFNKEAERTVKSIKNLWTPAKIGNQPIRYIYRLPLVMIF